MTRETKPFRITLILEGSSAVAQMESMERILEDDGVTVLTAKALPAEPLDFPLSEKILGAANAALLVRIKELEDELAEAKAAPPAPETTSIRAWQAKAVLQLSGLLTAAEQVIASLPEPDRTVVTSAWMNNADFSRTSPTISALGSALGLTEEQLEGMFSQAAALTV